VQALAPELRLPVVSIAVPQLTARPRTELKAVVTTLDALASADGRISLFEYCLTRLVASYVHDASDPVGRSTYRRGPLEPARDAALNLLAALAQSGNEDATLARRAFEAGARYLIPGPPGSDVVYAPPPDIISRLDEGWGVLDSLRARHKQRLVEAMVCAVREDGLLTLHEAELLRTACALLHCPMPSFVA
jgi:hypothetical protein